MTICFVVPDPSAFSSGGNLYNRALIEAFTLRGYELTCHTDSSDPPDGYDRYFWDTLYLDRLASWCDQFPQQDNILITHADTEEFRLVLPRLCTCRLRFLATGSYMVDSLLTQGIPAQRIILLEPPGLLQFPIRQKSLRDPGLPITLLMASSLTRDKGLLEFFRLWTAMGPPSPHALRIDVYGDDRIDESWAEKIKAVWKSAVWRDIVTFRGVVPRPEFLEVLPGYDALLSVSPAESYGMAIAEALTAGLPVLASSGGNVPNLVRDQVNGWLLPGHRELIDRLIERKDDIRSLPVPGYCFDLQDMPPQEGLIRLEEWLIGAFQRTRSLS